MAAAPPQVAAATATTIAKAIFRIQTALLDGDARSEDDLFAAAALISRPDYEDVVVERSIADLCGQPLCPNPLPSDRRRRGRYRISLREHRVYDLEETYKYCSEACLVASRAFAASLAAERTSDLNLAKVEEILARFARLGEAQEVDLGKEGELEISKLTIREKDDAGKGEVSLDQWIGPSNAIDGYVPQFDVKEGPKLKQGKNYDTMVEDSEVDFTSTIIFEGEDNGAAPSAAKTRDISDLIAKKLEGMVLTEKNTKTSKTSSKSSKVRAAKEENKYKSDRPNSLSAIDFESQTMSRSSVSNENYFSLLEGVNSLGLDHPGPYVFDYQVENSLKKLEKGLESDTFLNNNTESLQQSATEDSENGSIMKKDSKLKSALKSSGPKTVGRSVNWADQRNNVAQERKKDLEELPTLISEENDNSLRLASAEACAAALTKAAESVASGKSETGGAVSEAGILILPQPQNVNEGNAEEETDAFEFDSGYVKWPTKTVLLDTDMFEVEDSWHDTPPEGFSLTLSSFATMWMALFGWITCSSLAYIYGHDEVSQDDYLVVNGREYPRKIVLGDGLSSEIRITIDGCVSRALRGLVVDLQLPIPVSSMEKALGQLLDTMSFVEALPSFRLRQWQVVVLIFLEALSVHRLPALTPYMTNKEMLMHKVLNAAQIGSEEYESMRDLIIPLGRFPDLSMQRGG